MDVLITYFSVAKYQQQFGLRFRVCVRCLKDLINRLNSEEVILLSKHWKDSSSICKFRRLTLAIAVYYSWRFRNTVL